MGELKKITETERIYLREFIQKDAKYLYCLYNDREVIRYTGDSAFANEEASGDFIANYEQYGKYGFGRWAVVRKADNEFLGWCGLKFRSDEAIVEVGCRFYKKYWGQGYATEATGASLSYGFYKLKLAKIYAHVHQLNKASFKVVSKCGFQYVKDFDYNGLPASLFVKVNPGLMIKKIRPVETHAVRQPVLRPGRPAETCSFEGDNLGTTFHLGAFFGEKLVGVVTMMRAGGYSYQLRGMAVLEEFRKKGIGEELVRRAEEHVRNGQGNLVWMNAREVALDFYKRLGYKKYGKKFNIPLIGNHYKMKKEL
ncbi:GNAT family N-acetyltransferase [Zhouia spongiae]|uniref:GNAT family N-acetyltransferase n=1 Tax=Zhouia spongiae TaxID=2202721 RepID=A0ABY3YHF4_9FLAO|nr:GNAT family N-acetyltransferase [Zhouia spongiae]UNY97351.1 GNAT family N-acetyltransferase [Zhouia spongiae]